MVKRLFILVTIMNLSLTSCKKIEVQNLDINLSGKVLDQNGNGVANVTINIDRGKWGNFTGPLFQQYQAVTTDISGNYSYLIKDDGYTYRVCCKAPFGYSFSSESCVDVNHSIVNSRPVPNNINFTLRK